MKSRMKLCNPYQKGFFLSPFVLVMLSLLIVVIFFNLSEMDSHKTKSVLIQGKIMRDILNVEEMKLSIKTISLFASYQAAYDTGINSGNESELENRIGEYITEYIDNIVDNDAGGDIPIEAIPSNNGYFIIKNIKKPRIERNSSTFGIISNTSIEQVIDTRFFLLYNISKSFNYSLFEEKFSDNILGTLDREFTLSLDEYGSDGNKINIKGRVENSNNLNNSRFIVKNITEDSIVNMERNIGLYFPNIFNRNCSLIVMPRLITAHGSKSNISDETLWRWYVNVSLTVLLLDYSEIDSNFSIIVRRAIILMNGSLVPLKYRLNRYNTTLFYNISLRSSDAFFPEVINNYTENMFNLDKHRPVYSYRIERYAEWII